MKRPWIFKDFWGRNPAKWWPSIDCRQSCHTYIAGTSYPWAAALTLLWFNELWRVCLFDFCTDDGVFLWCDGVFKKSIARSLAVYCERRFTTVCICKIVFSVNGPFCNTAASLLYSTAVLYSYWYRTIEGMPTEYDNAYGRAWSTELFKIIVL